MNKQGELKSKVSDFSKYGLKPGITEVWEDGMRLNENNLKPGEYEWWYSEGHLTNGVFFVASFRIIINEKGETKNFISFNMSNESGIVTEGFIPIDPKETSFKKDICEVKMGNHYIKSLDELNTYEIYIDEDSNNGIGLNIKMEKEVPTYKPGTGFWEADGKFFAWLCTVPSAKITGTITIKGEVEKVEGNGYHDHNWGNYPMDTILGDWLWSRAEVNGITVVTSSVRFNEISGGKETKFVYLAKGNNIIIDAINDDVVCLEGEKKPHPKTGKKISSDCIYIVKNGNNYDYIRFEGKNCVASFSFGENEEWITWYARYVSETIVDISINGKKVFGKAKSTLEVMDFFGQKKE